MRYSRISMYEASYPERLPSLGRLFFCPGSAPSQAAPALRHMRNKEHIE